MHLPRTSHPSHSIPADDGPCTDTGVQSDSVQDRLLQRCAPQCSNLHHPEVAACAEQRCSDRPPGAKTIPRHAVAEHAALSALAIPVQQRIDYKVALLTLKVRSTSTPSYLHRLLQDRDGVHNLRRQSATPALCRPFTKTTIAKRAFRCTAPAIWNSLPKTFLDSDTVISFKSRLKTRLFSQAFSHTSTNH